MTNNFSTAFTDKYNAVMGVIVAILTAVFGIYWYIFAAYLLLNVIDWLSGWYKANKKKTESSKIGIVGALKKVGYWAIILVAFVISEVFVQLGNDVLGVNLQFLTMIGWFTLTMLFVNEARSILENLVELGYNVPEFLIKGLAVTEKMLKSKVDIPDIGGTTDEKAQTDD